MREQQTIDLFRTNFFHYRVYRPEICWEGFSHEMIFGIKYDFTFRGYLWFVLPGFRISFFWVNVPAWKNHIARVEQIMRDLSQPVPALWGGT